MWPGSSTPRSACLAVSVDGIGKEGVCVGVVELLAGRELAHGAVSVSEIISALDLVEVSVLVDVGGGLVLRVALAGEGREVVKVQVAVDHVALAGDGVGEDVAAAVVAHVGAVVVGDAGARGAALVGDTAEDAGDGAARAAVRGLEVLLHARGGAGRGGVLGGRGEVLAVAERLLRDLELLAAAVVLHVAALGHEGAALGGGMLAVDVHLDGVGLERDGILDGFVANYVDGAGGADGEPATGGQVVGLGDVDADLDGLAGRDVLDGRLLNLLGGDSLLDA